MSLLHKIYIITFILIYLKFSYASIVINEQNELNELNELNETYSEINSIILYIYGHNETNGLTSIIRYLY
jgi:hypothetical protein